MFLSDLKTFFFYLNLLLIYLKINIGFDKEIKHIQKLIFSKLFASKDYHVPPTIEISMNQ